MKVFVFPNKTGRKVGKPQPVGVRPQQTPAAQEVITPVQGIMPQSKPEWRVAMALDALGFEYQYQRSIGGGRSIRGGQVVDFWIYTAPKPTPAFVQGAYWHKQATSSEDDIKQAKVQHLYAGRVMPNLLLEEKYLGSVASATAYLRRELIG